MAVGKLSDFTKTKTTRPAGSVGGTNAGAPATGFAGLGPLAPRDFSGDFPGGGGDAPGAPPSGVTGMTPEANAMVGRGVDLASGMFGLPTSLGSLAGLVPGLGLGALPASLAINFAGSRLGIPTSIGKAVTMGLNAIAPNFPLAVNPNADPTATLGQQGLTAAQMATLANPDVFGLGDLSGVSLGALGAVGGSNPAALGFVAANPAGAGNVPAPAGGFIDAQGNISNATQSFTSPTNSFGFSPVGFSGLPGVSAVDTSPGAGVAPDTGSTGGVGDTSPGAGVAPDTGNIGAVDTSPNAGVAPDTGGTGGTSGGSGDTSGDAGSGFHRGGFVDLDLNPRRPGYDSPLDRHARSEVGRYGSSAPIMAEHGEFVVNKEAAGPFQNILRKMNELGLMRKQSLGDSLIDAIIQGAGEALRHAR